MSTLYLLKIGCESILLPDDKGLTTFLKALARARSVKNDHRYKDEGLDLNGPVEVCVEPLPGYHLVKRRVTHVTPERIPRQECAGLLTPARRLELAAKADVDEIRGFRSTPRLIGG